VTGNRDHPPGGNGERGPRRFSLSSFRSQAKNLSVRNMNPQQRKENGPADDKFGRPDAAAYAKGRILRSGDCGRDNVRLNA